MTIDDLTPEERAQVQEAWMRRWLAVKLAAGGNGRRKGDRP